MNEIRDFSQMINDKLAGGNNYLHHLMNNLSEENYENVVEIIKILLVNGCNPNRANDDLETPFYLMLKNLPVDHKDNNFISYVIDTFDVDFYSHKSEDVLKLMTSRGLQHKLKPKDEIVNDVRRFIKNLENWSESQFINELNVVLKASSDAAAVAAQLLQEAIAKNLKEVVTVLLRNGAEINLVPRNGRFNLAPAFLACAFGHYEILKVLLDNWKLKFECKTTETTLLHQLFLRKNVTAEDRKECFDLITADRRCTLKIINQYDGEGRTPLFFACHYGLNDIAIDLLRRGAYVGEKSVIDNINEDVLQEYLDECVKCATDVRDKNCEIHVDYRLLIPPNRNETLHSEMDVISNIARSSNSKVSALIMHPVIATVLAIKWKKIEHFVYFNILAYFCFMMFFGYFVFNHSNFDNSDKDYDYIEDDAQVDDELANEVDSDIVSFVW